jgi:hypothetical protein
VSHQNKYSTIFQVRGPVGNIQRTQQAAYLARQMIDHGFSAAILSEPPLDPDATAWLSAYDPAIPLASSEDVRDCEVLFRMFSFGDFPPRPGHPHSPHVVDFVFQPDEASGDADHVIALFPMDPPDLTPDGRIVRNSIVAPLPPMVYNAQKFTTYGLVVVCLGTDPLERVPGIVAAINESPAPRVRGSATAQQNQNITTQRVTLPNGVEVGEMLVAVLAVAGNPTLTWPAGWTVAFSGNNGGSVKLNVAWRVADGTEPRSLVVTSSAGLRSASVAYRVDRHGGAVYASASATGSSTAPNPPSLSPGPGSHRYLWLAVEGHDGNEVPTSGFPTSYRDKIGEVINGGNCAAAARQLLAASEDPAAFTLPSSNPWVAATIAVAPQLPSPYSARGLIWPNDATPSSSTVVRNANIAEQILDAEVGIFTPGPQHQTAGALGIPLLLCANGVVDDDRTKTALRFGRQFFRDIGQLSLLTDEQVAELAFELIEDETLKLIFDHEGRQTFGDTRTKYISDWIQRALLGAGQDDPYNVQGFDTLFPGNHPPLVTVPSSLLNDIAAAWRLDESTGDRLNEVDDSALGDLTPSGTVGQEPTGMKYQAATVATSAGGTNRLESAAAWDLRSDYALSFWVRRSSTGTVVIAQAFGSSEFQLTALTSGLLRLDVPAGTFDGVTSIGTGTFHHVLVDYSHPNGWRVYLDGALEISAAGFHQDTVLRPLRIGAQGTGAATFTFDEAYFWTRPMTDAEVADLQTRFYPFP